MELTETFRQSLHYYGASLGGSAKLAVTKRAQGPFERISRDCHQKVVRIKAFLGEVMPAYADFQNGMTDEERDKVDKFVSEALGEVENSIRSLDELNAQEESRDVREHQRGVVMLLFDSVRGVQETTNGARSLRQRHVLSSREKLCSVVTLNENVTIVDEDAVKQLEELDEEEMMLLEQENQQLEEHLSTVLEEARRIERNANEVSTLLAMFSEEVLNQHQVIGDLYDEAQKNVDIVNRVPMELHKAAENGRSFRRFMLIFLLASGLLLLLLDWMD